MRILIDGTPDIALNSEVEDGLAAVTAANDKLRENGRGILQVIIDGENVSPEGLLEALRGKAPSEIRQIEITSESIAKLVEDALTELDDAVSELPQLCRTMAQVFQSDTPGEGYEPFRQLAEIWAYIKARQLQVASALNVDLTDIELDGKNVDTMHEELNEFLEEAAGALESGDTVLLGDLLEYELAPRAEFEAKLVAWLKSQTEKPAQS